MTKADALIDQEKHGDSLAAAERPDVGRVEK